jgi:hypothetical protein
MRNKLIILLLFLTNIAFNQTSIVVSSMTGFVDSSTPVVGDTYEVQVISVVDPTGLGDGQSIDESGNWVLWKDKKRYVVTGIATSEGGTCGTCFSGASTVVVQVTADDPANGSPTTGLTAIFINETSNDLSGFIANINSSDQQALSSYYLTNLDVKLGESGASDAVVINVPASGTLAVGTVVSNDGTGNYAAIDTSSAIAGHGLIREDNGARANVVTEGKIAVPSHGKTLHVPLYVSETAGELTETQYDENVQPIAIAFDTDSILVTSKMMLGGGFGGGGSSADSTIFETSYRVDTAKTNIRADLATYQIKKATVEKYTNLTSGNTITATATMPSNLNNVLVYRNGIIQEIGVGLDCTISGQNITFNLRNFEDGEKVMLLIFN